MKKNPATTITTKIEKRQQQQQNLYNKSEQNKSKTSMNVQNKDAKPTQETFFVCLFLCLQEAQTNIFCTALIDCYVEKNIFNCQGKVPEITDNQSSLIPRQPIPNISCHPHIHSPTYPPYLHTQSTHKPTHIFTRTRAIHSFRSDIQIQVPITLSSRLCQQFLACFLSFCPPYTIGYDKRSKKGVSSQVSSTAITNI